MKFVNCVYSPAVGTFKSTTQFVKCQICTLWNGTKESRPLERIQRESNGHCRARVFITAASIAIFSAFHFAQADDLEDYNFFGQSSPATFAPPVGAVNTNLDSSSTLTRGAGAVASTGSNSFRTVGFKNDGISTSNTDYFQFQLSAATGDTLSLSNLSAIYNGTSGFAPVSTQFAYSLDGSTFTLIGSATSVTSLPTASPVVYSLSGVPALQNLADSVTVTLRLYASGATTTGGFGFYSSAPGAANDGLMVNGTIATGILTYDPSGAGAPAFSTSSTVKDFTDSGSTSGTDVAYKDGNTVNFTDAGITNPKIAVSGTVSPAAVNVSNGSGTYTISGGSISGSGGLTKTGGGALVNSENDSYTGVTAANGGLLVVNGSLTNSAVTIGTAGTLAGAGTISKTVGVSGVITAGTGATSTDKPGQLTISGTTTINNGGVYSVKIDGAQSTVSKGQNGDSAIAGVGNDVLQLSGFSSAGTGTINPVLVNSASFTPYATYSYLIATDTGANTSADEFAQLIANVAAQNAGYTLSDDFTPGSSTEDLYLNETTPEPTSVLLIGGAVFPLALSRRRRKAAISVQTGTGKGDITLS